MSIVRLNYFKAKPESTKELQKFLTDLIPTLKSLPGCQGCELLSQQDDPLKFVILERWENIEAHKNSAKNIPSDQMKKVMLMLSEPPSGHYFHPEH